MTRTLESSPLVSKYEEREKSMSSDSEGLQQHPGSAGRKDHEMFQGESPPSPTVAVPERVKKELEEKRREREAGTDQSARDQLDDMARSQHRWQPLVDRPQKSSKPED